MDIINHPLINLLLILTLHIGDKLFMIYIFVSQLFVYQMNETRPKILKRLLPTDYFQEFRLYGIHKMQSTLWETVVFVLILGCFELYLGLYPLLWNAACCLSNSLSKNDSCCSLIFLYLLTIYVFFKYLPAAVYNKYYMQIQHNVTPKRSLVLFMLKNIGLLIVQQIYLLPFAALLLSIIHVCEKFCFMYVWLTTAVISLIILVVVPMIIDPIMLNNIPLPEGELRNEISVLTEQLNFPISRVSLIKTTDNDSHCGNAYFLGCACFKRLCLFDNLLLKDEKESGHKLDPWEYRRGLNNKEVVAVVAHELGHWHGSHNVISVCLIQIYILVSMFAVWLCSQYPPFYEAVGFEPGQNPIVVGVCLAFAFILTPYMTISKMLMLTLLQNFEYKADEFAFGLGYSNNLKASLLKNFKDCPSWPFFDDLYSKLMHSHPTIFDRIDRLNILEEDEI